MRYEHHLHIKSKAIPITGCEGLKGCEMLRIRYYVNNRLTGGGKVVSLTRPLIYFGKINIKSPAVKIK
jgi:hypothetical protein